MSQANWKNRTLFHGDNLDILRGMNSESVDLIATDPPFNKGRDFHATPDSLTAGSKFQDRWSWDADVHQSWVDQIIDDHPKLWGAIEAARFTHSDSMGAFLCFLSVRVLAMHRILKPTGSLYLHCDTTANSYIRLMLDAIFGARNFRNEIVWHYQAGTKPKTAFGRKHDTIFYYTKSSKWHYVRQGQPVMNPDRYNLVDDDGRLFLWGGNWDSSLKRGTKKYYLDDGRACDDVWSWIEEHNFNSLNSQSSERLGYPTQKPIALYERIIKASSPEGGIVLDPFAGCATTCVAAERLGRQWVGIDLWNNAAAVVAERMERECAGIFGGRIEVENKPPKRTDDGQVAAPFLRVKERAQEPAGAKMSRDDMKAFLVEQDGSKCQGCGREFDDTRYLELDHNTPRADGGINHISNRVLLCGPCNRLKSNTYTLSGLRRENKKRGFMVKGAS